MNEDLRLHGLIGGGGGSNIKSIQQGTVTLSSASVSQAITTVDLTKSILMFYYISTNNSDGGEKIATRGVLTNSTTLTFVRNTTSTNAITVYWKVIEFNNVKSVQRGVSSVNLSGLNVAITSVDVTKSLVFASFNMDYSSTTAAMTFSSELTSSTNLQLKNPTGTTKSVAWQVIEFN